MLFLVWLGSLMVRASDWRSKGTTLSSTDLNKPLVCLSPSSILWYY